jgi:hypothetical protein
VRDDQGRASIVLNYDGRAVGIVSMSWLAYEALCREIMTNVVKIARNSMTENLGTLLWQDAQRSSQEDPDLAKRRLLEFGWSQEQIERYADVLAKNLATILVNVLPEYVP